MRKPNDFYPTEARVTRQLLNRVHSIAGNVFECCAGDGAMAKLLEKNLQVFTNDINQAWDCDYHEDATKPDVWKDWFSRKNECHWVVTNPPFNQAHLILPLA